MDLISSDEDDGCSPPMTFPVQPERIQTEPNRQWTPPRDEEPPEPGLQKCQPSLQEDSDEDDEEDAAPNLFSTAENATVTWADQVTPPPGCHVHMPQQVQVRVEPVAPMCGLCHLRRGKNYCCPTCVEKGDFIHSGRGRGAAIHGHMADLKFDSLRVQGLKEELTQSIHSKLVTKNEQAKLLEEVFLAQRRVRYLQRLTQDAKESTLAARESAAKLKSINARRTERLPTFPDRVDKISRCVSSNRADLTTEARKVSHQARTLDARRNQHTKALFRHLFPVQPCVREQEDDDIVAASEADDDPNLESGCNFEMMETMADAMSTSYIQGKWVTTSGSAFTYKPVNVVSAFDDTQAGKSKSHDPEGPTDYIIAGFATLPADGDYLTCAATSEDTSALSAGLTLTSQLVAGLFDVWDVLPALAPKRPLNFGLDFASVPSYDDEDSAVRRKFARKVCRLNLNVLHLCLRLGISPDRLSATKTLQNIHSLASSTGQLLGTHDLSAEKFFQLALCSRDAIISQANIDEFSDDDETVVGFNVDDDWESLGADASTGVESVLSSPENTVQMSSTASFIMSSLARGFGVSTLQPPQ